MGWSTRRSSPQVLDENLLGPKKKYLCGEQITIADYFGGPFVALGEILRCNYAAYPNVNRWLGRMKALKSWGKVHEVFYGFAASLKDKAFEAV